MNYNLKLNIKNVPNNLIIAMKDIATDCGYNIECIENEITFSSSRGLKFTELINRLERVCDLYNVDYISLLL